MVRELTDHEKTIAAAAYLQGLAIGLAHNRGKRWHRDTGRSELARTRVYGTVDEILRDGCASNPILIYEMRDLAERCGLFEPSRQKAHELVQDRLRNERWEPLR